MDYNKFGFLFDLDGVLIDSEREYSKIWATVNAEYPTGVASLEEKIKGCTLDKILADHYPDQEVRVKVVERLYELEAKMKYEYLPGAEELLKELQRKNIARALVTSSNDVKMKHLDEELPDLRSFFNVIITADLISRSKPDPEGYLLAAEKLQRDINYCVVFEDSLQGVKAGRAAGAYVVGIAGTLKPEILAPFADIVVDNLSEVDFSSLLDAIEAHAEKSDSHAN